MKLALAGDTMLGRMVAERLKTVPPTALFSEEVIEATHEADLFILNLECAISDRGERWRDPTKRFHFRAPPVAVDVLHHLGVSCVTLANNHALDFGTIALLDTFEHLARGGIAWVGAGIDEAAARAPTVVDGAGVRIGVIGVTDHPADFAAGHARPGVAFADLRRGAPRWLLDSIGGLDTDVVLVTPHWGPNMVTSPLRYVRAAAAAFRASGATLVAGHSAHVFHGVADHVVYDLGDFIDDYATDPRLRNDLGLLFLVTFDNGQPTCLETIPLALDYCHTRLATNHETEWITDRFRRACAAMGTELALCGGRLVVQWEMQTGTSSATPAGSPTSGTS